MEKITYMADDYIDEIPGVVGTLERCAEQFTGGVWGDPEPKPGDRFRAEKTTWLYTACERQADGTYRVPGTVRGKIHAVAYKLGLGWSPSMLVSTPAEAKELMDRIGGDPEEYLVTIVAERRGHLVIGKDGADRLTCSFEPDQA